MFSKIFSSIRLLPVLLITIFYSFIAAFSRLIDRHNKIYHKLMRSWSKVVLSLLGVKVSATGIDFLKPGQPYLFLANHSSYLDIVAIGAVIPGGGLFVYKEELARVPIWGWSLRLSPFIMIKRSAPRESMKSIEAAAEEIRTGGESVIIFPEGTRSSDGKLGQFKRGGFLLAAKTAVPIVPLAIRGASELLPRGGVLTRPGRIEIEIAKPIEIDANIGRATERMLQNQIENSLREMLEG